MNDIMWYVIFSTVMILALFIGSILWYVYVHKDENDYEKAKDDIFVYVKAYKKKCRGNNRFVVTVETLQDVFREYDTKTINRVWLDLIQDKIIEIDPYDGVWCVR